MRGEPTNAAPGAPGETRFERFHVPDPRGGVRSLELAVVVHAGTDPELAERAREGRLHRVGGHRLDEPFVYHDPSRELFCLVVPISRAHHALGHRRDLLARLDGARDHRLPTYVLEPSWVLGVDELRAVLGLPALVREPITRVGPADEAPMAAASVGVGVRDDDFAAAVDDGAAEGGEMTAGATVVHRVDPQAGEYVDIGDDLPAPFDRSVTGLAIGDVAPSDDVRGAELTDSASAASADGAEPDEHEVDDSVEELVDEPSSGGVSTLSNDEILDAVRDDDVQDAAPEADDVLSAVEALPDDEDTGGTGGADEDVEGEDERTLPVDGGELEPVPAPPAALRLDHERRTVLTIDDRRGLMLFARTSTKTARQLEERPVDLRIQLARIEETPVVYVTLVPENASAEDAIHAPLDPRDGTEVALLEALSRECSVTLVALDEDDAPRFSRRLRSAREQNVQRILERLGHLGRGTLDPRSLRRRALAEPPPLALAVAHPFGARLAPAKDTREAAERVATFAHWCAPERFSRVLLELSVPEPFVDAALGRVIDDAMAVGIALPRVLRQAAIRLGRVDDEATLLAAQLDAFGRTTDAPDRGGLASDEAALNWARLLDTADATGVDVDPTVRAVAESAVVALRRLLDSDAPVEPESLRGARPVELAVLLEHPKAGADAAIELLRRRSWPLLSEVVRALRKMDRASVRRVAPALVELGPEAAPALRSALGARKTFVRQAVATVLAELSVPESAPALVRLLSEEQSDSWREIARLLASLGPSGVAALGDAKNESSLPPARLRYTMAHVLAGDDEPLLRRMAARDLGLSRRVAEAEAEVDAARAHCATIDAEDRPADADTARWLKFAWELRRAMHGPASFHGAKASASAAPGSSATSAAGIGVGTAPLAGEPSSPPPLPSMRRGPAVPGLGPQASSSPPPLAKPVGATSPPPLSGGAARHSGPPPLGTSGSYASPPPLSGSATSRSGPPPLGRAPMTPAPDAAKTPPPLSGAGSRSGPPPLGPKSGTASRPRPGGPPPLRRSGADGEGDR